MPHLENEGAYRMAPSLTSTHTRFLCALSQAELEPFLQRWLFSGLLHEVLGDLYRHDEYVTTCPDYRAEKSIITIAKLI